MPQPVEEPNVAGQGFVGSVRVAAAARGCRRPPNLRDPIVRIARDATPGAFVGTQWNAIATATTTTATLQEKMQQRQKVVLD